RGGLTKALTLKLHKLLMHNILWRYAGRFRDIQVRVGDFYPPPPESVPDAFSRLMRWYIGNKNRYHPLVVAAHFHAHFERVHPFRDGNGRTGRLLLNHILRSAGYPMLSIPVLERKRYYATLQAVDSGNLRPLVELLRDRLLAERF
ncbi:MAG TPA: Fic family protein, partial [archaeon]|nr:Fic family protein [archaeon]